MAPISPADVYTMGAYLPGSGFDQTLVERWNGSSWSRVSSPNVATLYNDLLGVTTALATGQVVAVGTETTGTYYAPGATRTLVEQARGV